MSWIADVQNEMTRQDDKWGAQRDNPTKPSFNSIARVPDEQSIKEHVNDAATDNHGIVPWSDILLEEIVEAFVSPTREHLRTELIQCAAVIGQWINAIEEEIKRMANGLSNQD